MLHVKHHHHNLTLFKYTQTYTQAPFLGFGFFALQKLIRRVTYSAQQ